MDKNLMDYYKQNFILMENHKWNIEYIDNLIPFEKEIYVTLLTNYLRELKEKQDKSI